MPAQLTTREQVNGYRFLLHRFDHALVRRDVRMLHDPMRIQFRSFITGLVLAVLVTGGCAVLAFLHPQGQVGQSKIIMTSDSGALYVNVDNTLHPALNLTSARLITGSNQKPASVAGSKLAGLPRGPLLGIPGVPAALPGPADHQNSEWTLCDDVSSAGVKTTVLSGTPQLGAAIGEAGAGDALLVSDGTATYLLYDGKRAQVNMNDTAVVTALGLRGLQPRQISDGLLNSTVAVPNLAAPAIPLAGAPSSIRRANVPVGTVIRVENIGGATLFVVLSDGIQKLSPFAAQVLRTAGSMGQNDLTTVPPDAIAGVPVVNHLAVDQFPTQQPHILTADDQPVSCANWARGQHDPVAHLRLLVGRQVPLAASMHPVALVDGGRGRSADSVYIPPSTGEYVQVTDIAPDSARREVLFYITDTGVRFGIPDAATAATLGLTDPKLAPWQIVSKLPAGPMLDREAALVAHDTLDSSPTDSPPGKR
ncbi:MAG: type VII secretion protein EccB [Mycobacterium sp.]|nr:type VII secretion protein EccB [Mycobacterium sp.]